jgi:hypothetical protein
MASAFFPLLLPATMAKPQLGIPVAFTSLSKRGVLACIAVIALAFLVMPRWPWYWIAHFQRYQRFIPLLVFPGPLLVLALLRWRRLDGRLLFLMSVVPQRWLYDPLILWLIPEIAP